jgi:DNA-binding transcriptional MerR regulator
VGTRLEGRGERETPLWRSGVGWAQSALLYFLIVDEAVVQVDIPRRALFKAAEVCDLVKVQPYVLRSWETEFPALGIAKTTGSARVYRRADVEQVVRIKHLLLVEGLTLAGARRRLEEESTPVAADMPVIDELIGRNTRERLTEVKRGLRSILELLAGGNSGRDLRLASPVRSGAAQRVASRRVKPVRRKVTTSRSAPSARRKRPAT